MFFGKKKFFRSRICRIFFPGTPDKAIITKITILNKINIDNIIFIESGGIWCQNVTFKIISKRGYGYCYKLLIYGGRKEELITPDPMDYFYSIDSDLLVPNMELRNAVYEHGSQL